MSIFHVDLHPMQVLIAEDDLDISYTLQKGAREEKA